MRELLERLGREPGALPFSELYVFSDLAGEKLAEFCSAWDDWSETQRRRLVRSLADLAEANIHVNFDAVFRHAIDDPDDMVRTTAINGLWENEDVTLVGPLLNKLRSDPSHQVRAAAAEGLGRFVLAGELDELESTIQARIVTELLTTFHLADESIAVRRRAVESMAYACTPEVSELLETAYNHVDEMMRLSAVVGMGRTCSKRWREIVLEELESSSAAMRYEAVVACGGLGLRVAIPHLTALLQDADPQLRTAAIWSLGQIGGDRAKQVLLSALEEAEDDTTTALEEALAELALGEGDLDLLLYDIDEDPAESMLEEELDDDWDIMRSSIDEEDLVDGDDWEF